MAEDLLLQQALVAAPFLQQEAPPEGGVCSEAGLVVTDWAMATPEKATQARERINFFMFKSWDKDKYLAAFFVHLAPKILPMLKLLRIKTVSFCLFFVGLGILQAQEGLVSFKMKITGEMADLMGPMMPNKMTVRYKDGNSRISMEGGMAASMMGDIVYLSEKNEAYMLRDKEKTAYKMPDKQPGENVKPEVTLLGEEEMNGYKCRKYKIVIKGEKDGSVDQIMWATDDIKMPKPKKSAAVGSGSSLFLDEIEGFPVKVELSMQQMGINLNQIIELDKYDPAPQDPALFRIPENFKIKDFDPKMFGGGR